MTTSMTRDELIARIEAGEARSDARYIAFEKRTEAVMHRIGLDLVPLKNIKTHIWCAAFAIITTFVALFIKIWL